MADPANPPGERRLSHPPSDRYATAGPGSGPGQGPPPTSGRTRAGRPASAVIAALAGAASITALGGVLAVTAGLVVVAAAAGWVVGALLPGRARAAVILASAAVALGQLGLWAYALAQGGVLGPIDLLWQVYGVLVALEFLAAAILAWVGAR